MTGNNTSNNIESRKDFVKNAAEAAEAAFNGFNAVEDNFRQNINRFQTRQSRDLTEEETWDMSPGNYDVEKGFNEAGHDISDIDLRVDLDGVVNETGIESETLEEYMHEMDTKLERVRRRKTTAQEESSSLDAGENNAKDNLLESLLRGEHEEDPDPEQLQNSAAAEDNRTLEEIESLNKKSTELLDRHIQKINRLESAYNDHIENVADSYHEDAKEQVKETSGGFRESVEGFVDVARAITAVRENTFEDPEFLSEEVAGQEPVLDAGEDALYMKANEVMDYVVELAEASQDIEYVADRLSGMLEDDELDCMNGTVENLREGMVAKIASEAEEYLEDRDYGDEAGYSDNYAEIVVNAITDVMDKAGFEPEVENLDESMLEDEYGLRA